ncbi:MAG: hypothetical protein QOF61_275 [Acidobacteriota bacterium]|nr:hypothetical protein [Acidobacteriota bacterium]
MMNAYPQPPRFVTARLRAQLTTALLLIDGGLCLIAVVVLLLILGHLSGASADIGRLTIGLVALAKIAVRLTTVVLFLMWLHRAYENLRAFAPRTETSPGWAVGYWFIPFANFVRPFQVVKEIWIKSDPAVDFTNGYGKLGEGARTTTLLGFWWGFWLLSNFANGIYNRLNWKDRLGRIPVETLWAGVASNLLTLVAAVLAASVVWTINRMQSEKSQRHGYDLWTPPPPPPDSFEPRTPTGTY